VELLDITSEMEATLKALDSLMIDMHESATESVNTRCDYEDKKNRYVLELKAEELADPKLKRTDKVRQSMYRLQFNNERQQWLAKDSAHDVNKLVHKGLLAKLNALQSLLRLVDGEIKMSNIQAAR